MPAQNPLDQIAKIQAQIAELQQTALTELKVRRSAAVEELKGIEAEIEKLVGKPVKAPRGNGSAEKGALAPARKPDLQELKALLAEAPEKTISLRKEGFDVRNIRVMAEANPHLLRMGGKGPWPTVTLLK